MLDKIFDKVYVITVINSDRVETTKEQMKKAGIKDYEFVTSVDYRIIDRSFVSIVHPQAPAQKYISLCSNCISLVQSAIYNEYDSICICEDDIYFKDDYKKLIREFMNAIPDDWDMINFGYLNDIRGEIEINDFVKKQIGKIYGAHCVAYKKSVFNDIINIYYNFGANIPMDWFGEKICNKYNVYTPSKHFIFQTSRDYNDYNLNLSGTNKLFDSLLFNREIPEEYL